MIKFTVFHNAGGDICGFKCEGHAGFDEYGKDIVCAGVSSLVLTCMNSIEMLTKDEFEAAIDEDSGNVDFILKAEPTDSAELLLESMILGIEMIADEYKNRIRFNNKEV